MPNFKEPTIPEEQSEQLSAPEQNDALEQDKQGPEDELSPESLQKKFDQQDAQSDEVIGQADELLDHIDGIDDEEPEATERLNEKTSELLGKFRKSKALRAVAMLTALVLPAEAYGDTLDKINKATNSDVIVTKNGRLKPKTMHGDAHLNSVLETLQGAQNPHEQMIQNNLKGVEFGTSRVNKLNAVPIRLHRIGEYPTVNSLDGTQQNILRNRKVLQGVTVNGSPVYEIAPGVYGNEHSQYGDGVSIGTINIGD